MPNMKVYLDDTLPADCRMALRAALPEIRDMLCRELKVDKSVCQLAILPVVTLDDQPRANVELMILPKPDRTKERVREVCGMLREMVAGTTGVPVAVRAANLDPETYIALK